MPFQWKRRRTQPIVSQVLQELQRQRKELWVDIKRGCVMLAQGSYWVELGARIKREWAGFSKVNKRTVIIIVASLPIMIWLFCATRTNISEEELRYRQAQEERAERRAALDQRLLPQEQEQIRREVGSRNYSPSIGGRYVDLSTAAGRNFQAWERAGQEQQYRNRWEAVRVLHGLSVTEMEVLMGTPRPGTEQP